MKPFPADFLTTWARAARWLAVLYGLMGIATVVDLWLNRTFAVTVYPLDYTIVGVFQLVVVWMFLLLQLIPLVRLATWTAQFAPNLDRPHWQLYLGFYLPVWNLVAPTTFFASLELDRRQLRIATWALWLAVAFFVMPMALTLKLASSVVLLSLMLTIAFAAYSVALRHLALAFTQPLAQLRSIRRKIVLPRSECELSEVE